MTMHYTRFSKRALPAILAIALGSAAPAAAQEAGASLVIVSGESIVRRAPDVAYLTLSVESRAGSPRDAQPQSGR